MTRPSSNAVVLGDFIADTAHRALPDAVVEATGQLVRAQVATMRSFGDAGGLRDLRNVLSALPVT